MINPVLIIITCAVLLSVLVICIINKPAKPLFTGSLIVVTIFYVLSTFFLDNAISIANTGNVNEFITFLTGIEKLSYESLSASFRTITIIDIGLFSATVISMIVEIAAIFRKPDI